MAEEFNAFGEEEGPEEELNEEEQHDDEIRSVASSMVSAWGYERETEQLKVFFVNGQEGSYACSPEQWEEAKQAVSPGRWMHANVL